MRLFRKLVMYPLAMWNIRPSIWPCDMNASMEGTLSLIGNLTTPCEWENLEVQYQVQPPMSLTGMIIVSTNYL